MIDIITAAHQYFMLGFSIIPVQKNSKVPAVKWKDYQNRQCTWGEIGEWFVDNNLNIGLVTGEISGLIVIDEDSYKEKFKNENLESPLFVTTPRGGRHLYFKYDEPIKNSVNADKATDIRGTGGFVLLPPSSIDGNFYKWNIFPTPEILSSLPVVSQTILDILKPVNNQGGTNSAYHDISLDIGTTEGSRNDTLHRSMLSILNRVDKKDWDSVAIRLVLGVNNTFAPPMDEGTVIYMFERAKRFVLANPTARHKKEWPIDDMKPRSIFEVATERKSEKALENEAPSTGYPELDRIIKGFIPGHLYTLTGSENVGKCEAFNTPHLMFNGSIKMVQDLKIGDLLMGPDNKPRKILSTTSGEDEMYLIKQDWGLSYTVNKSHILSLKWRKMSWLKKKAWKEYEPEKIQNISVDEYLNKSKLWKTHCSAWHVPVNFPKREVLIDPYFLGAWLGDGSSDSIAITGIDEPVISYFKNYVEKNGLVVKTFTNNNKKCPTYHASSGKQLRFININNKQYNREQAASLLDKSVATITNWMKNGKLTYSKKQNPLFTSFKKYNLLGNKHIPDIYRANSRENRLQLLAGIIDTDGWVQKNISKNTNKQCYSYAVSIVNKKLADDILLLCCSLGFNSRIRTKIAKMKRKDGTVYEVLCYTVSIQGDLSVIPVKIERKKIINNRVKSVGFSAFKVIPKGRDKYYGFTLDKDGLYLLSDCTVTHNTSIACNFATRIAKQGKKVLYFALEPENAVVDYIASARLDKRFDELTDEDVEFDDGNIHIFGKEQVSNINDLVKIIEKLDRYDLIIIDHIGYFVGGENNFIQEQSNVIKRLAGLTKSKRTAIMMIAHLRKPPPGAKKNYSPTSNDISGSGSFKQDSTEVIILNRFIETGTEGAAVFSNDGMINVTKTKCGPNGSVPIYFSNNKAIILSANEVFEKAANNKPATGYSQEALEDFSKF